MEVFPFESSSGSHTPDTPDTNKDSRHVSANTGTDEKQPNWHNYSRAGNYSSPVQAQDGQPEHGHIDDLMKGTTMGVPNAFMPGELWDERVLQWTRAVAEHDRKVMGSSDIAEEIGYKDPTMHDPRERNPRELRGIPLPCGQVACSVADGCPKFKFATEISNSKADTNRTLAMCQTVLEIQADQSGGSER